jgi:hypothetical protein
LIINFKVFQSGVALSPGAALKEGAMASPSNKLSTGKMWIEIYLQGANIEMVLWRINYG